MTEQLTTDVLITGAGAAGLTLAIELARRGVAFRLIDKLERPFEGSRGKGVQPRTQEIFEDLGILDRIVAAGGLYPRQRQYDAIGGYVESDVVEPAPATPTEPHRLPLMIPQFLTEAIMRERLLELGHHVEFGCALTGFNQDANGVTARLTGASGEESVRARYLVGADGGRSFVRHALEIGFPGKTLGVRALVADVMASGLSRDVWHRYGVDMDNQLSICPLMGTDMFQIQAPIPEEGEPDLTAKGLTHMVAQRSGRPDILVQSVSWASAFSMNARLADHYRKGRVFLAGDAAHIHPPTGGQGLNTSIQDAYNLGWKLAAVLAGAPTALLDSYEAERRPVAADMLGLATHLLDAAKRGDLRRGREVRQLDIGYPQSPLALVNPQRDAGLLAGDRAPDAPIRGAAGQDLRLFDLFKGCHCTLLGYEDKVSPLAARPGLHIHRIGPSEEIIDATGLVRDAYGLSPGDWALIRPDGYIGAIFTADMAASMENYLGGVGLRRPD